jgi:hypothetical protein
MTTLIKKLMGPIDALRECMALFRAGFCLERGWWSHNDRMFYSRRAAVEHMRLMMVNHAIERSLRK